MNITLPATNIAPPQEVRRPYLRFLDGVRGLAALYVVLFHVTGEAKPHLSPGLARSLEWLGYGHYGVDLFIVLSGFCLMLPVVYKAIGDEFVLPGGLAEFAHRRAWRILPAYYAALAFSMLLPLLSFHGLSALGRSGASMLPGVLATLGAGNVISHVLLLYNWDHVWCYAFNYPLWSVAVEWQIYFLFALALLPAIRRFGIVPSLAGAWVVSLAPHFLLPRSHNLDWTFPWMVGLFALGAAAAVAGVRLQSSARDVRPLLVAVTVAASAITCFLVEFQPALAHRDLWLTDLVMGIGAAAFILYGQQCARYGVRPPVIRLLESPCALFLGAISFSLYLVHKPLLLKFCPISVALTRHFHLSYDANYFVFVFVGVPVVIAFSYLFHRAFERPYLARRRKAVVPEPTPAAIARQRLPLIVRQLFPAGHIGIRIQLPYPIILRSPTDT